jgi:hypothetical protein
VAAASSNHYLLSHSWADSHGCDAFAKGGILGRNIRGVLRDSDLFLPFVDVGAILPSVSRLCTATN